MRKIGFWLATCLCTSTAWAGGNLPTVEILSPTAGQCVNNGGEVGTGGILGGEAVPEPNVVEVRTRLGDPEGRPLSITINVDGADVLTSRYDFQDGATEADVEFYIDPFILFDSPRLDMTITVRPLDDPNTTAVDDVVFELDREPPVIRVDIDQLDAIEQCAEVPDLDFILLDNVFSNPPAEPAQNDPTVQLDTREEIDGCLRRTIYTVTDTCGNAQEYELSTQIPAPEGTISSRLVGYRCGIDGLCVTDGDDAVTFDADDRIGRGTVVFEIDAPVGCVDLVDAVLMTEEDFVDECPAFEDLEVDENGLLINPCPFLVPGQAIEEPGGYVARLTVSSCGQEVVRDELPFTILDPPVADPGGPYVVTQGEPVMLDAGGAVVPEELGGLVGYAWDLNGDRFFDSGELGEDLNGNGIEDPFEADRNNNGMWDPPVDINGNGEIDLLEVFPALGGVAAPVALETDADGEFSVSLRVTAGNGAEALAEASVTVEDIDPDCQIGGPYEALEGEAIVFDASASTAGHPSDPLVAWNWDFGDQVNPQRGDDLPRPAHIYRQAGEFTVTLELEDIDSSAECQAIVTVAEVEPVVEGIGTLNDEDELVEGETIVMTAGESRAGSDSDPLVDFAWAIRRVGQAGEPLLADNGPLLRSPEFVFDDEGDYEVCLTVTDEDGDATTDCFELSIADLSPIARCAGPEEAVEGEELAFDALGSRPGGPADPIVRIEWDFGDGEPPVVVDNFNVAQPAPVLHTFRGNGLYTVNMTVFDEDNDARCSFDIDVADTRPTAALEVLYAGGEQTGYEGEPVEFDASDSAEGADAIVRYTFDFGDGSPPLVSDEPRVEYSYADNGDYQVRVTVQDQDGSTEQATLVARVANRDPTVELRANELQFELGQQVQFVTVIDGNVPQNGNPQVAAVVGDVEADLPPRVVEWDFGDGSPPDTRLRPDHRYNAIGEYTVTVLVEDADGGTAEAEIEVEVTAAAPRIAIVEPQTTREGVELVVDVAVEAPLLGEDPATLQINIPGQPPGAEVEVLEDGPADRIVRMTWTPTYYQAGRYTLQVRAAAVEVPRSDRTRNISIIVDEGGTPRLAAVGGTAGRGVMTIYDYGADDFRAVAEVELGLGVGGVAAAPDGRFVFAAVPGSDRVAVVQTSGRLQPTPVRRIPVGSRPASVATGMGYVWVVNAGSNDMSIIEIETLKVVGTVDLAPVQTPTDVVWLPDGFDGIAGATLAVIGRRGGHVAIVDAAAALAGQDAVLGSIQTGGVLTRIAAAPTGWLHVADAKTRRIYRMNASDVAGGRDAGDGVPLSFAPRDLTYQGETLYVATGDALLEVTDDGDVRSADLLIEAQALTTADEQILGGGALVVASPTRIENLSPGVLGRLRNAGATRIRWLTAFVALE